MSRDDPTGKRALFTPAGGGAAGGGAAAVATPERGGRAALFSSGPARAGTVLVECSDCGARSRLWLLDLGLRLFPFSLWCPVRTHPHWMRCPACEQYQWCRIDWTG